MIVKGAVSAAVAVAVALAGLARPRRTAYREAKFRPS